MATNDWKAELKRRIQSIRERKLQDSGDHGENQPFQRSSVAPETHPIKDNSSISINEDGENDNRDDVRQTSIPSEDDHQIEVTVTNERAQRSQDKATDSPGIKGSSSAEKKAKTQKTVHRSADSVQKEATKEEELTLFPVEPLSIRTDDASRATEAEHPKSSTSSDSKGTTAAPFGSEAEELIDSYVPLESYAAQNSEKEVESQVDAVSYRPNRSQRRTNILRVAAATTDLVILTASEATIIWMAGLLAETNPLDLLMNSIWSFGWLFMALHFLYYVLFTSTTGQTPGKSAFGLKVVRERPGTIGIGKGIARWLFMLLSLAPLAFGYIFLFFNRNGRSLYDLALGHQVQRIDQ